MAQKTSTKKPAKNASKKAATSMKKSPVAARASAVKSKTKSAPASKSPPKKTAAAAAAPVKEGKKEKVATALSRSDLQYFRNLLLEKRRELLGDVGSMESEAFKSGSNLSNMPIHMADVGTDNFEQEFTLGLIESERQFLRDIQEALIRIDDGTYGICQGTGKPIPRVRLEAVPWAKYTIEYSRLLESGKISRESGNAEEESGGGGGGDEDEE
jgi:RNA polymerase-binding protein DksA